MRGRWLVLLFVAGCSDPVASAFAGAPSASALPVLAPKKPWALPTRAPARIRDLVKRCEAGEGLPCRQIGDLFAHGHGVPDDGLAAARFYGNACTERVLDGCVGLARASFEGHGAPVDAAKGASILRSACDRGAADACAELGVRLAEGRGIAFDDAAGRALVRKSCDGGSFDGCRWLVERDPTDATTTSRANDLARGSCTQGFGAACAWGKKHDAATGFDWASRGCLAVDPEPFGGCEGAADQGGLMQQACDAGDVDRCIDLAFLLVNGGDRSDAGRKKFVELVARACRAGSPRGCWALAKDRPEVRKEACREGELSACRPMRRDATAPTDDERRFACENGSATDCRELVEKRSIADARAILERACPDVRSREDWRDLDAEACGRLGAAYRTGDGVAADPKRAASYLERACFAQGRFNRRGVGCGALAEMYEQGVGVERDPARALSLYAGLCYADRSQCAPFLARGGKTH